MSFSVSPNTGPAIGNLVNLYENSSSVLASKVSDSALESLRSLLASKTPSAQAPPGHTVPGLIALYNAASAGNLIKVYGQSYGLVTASNGTCSLARIDEEPVSTGQQQYPGSPPEITFAGASPGTHPQPVSSENNQHAAGEPYREFLISVQAEHFEPAIATILPSKRITQSPGGWRCCCVLTCGYQQRPQRTARNESGKSVGMGSPSIEMEKERISVTFVGNAIIVPGTETDPSNKEWPLVGIDASSEASSNDDRPPSAPCSSTSPIQLPPEYEPLVSLYQSAAAAGKLLHIDGKDYKLETLPNGTCALACVTPESASPPKPASDPVERIRHLFKFPSFQRNPDEFCEWIRRCGRSDLRTFAIKHKDDIMHIWVCDEHFPPQYRDNLALPAGVAPTLNIPSPPKPRRELVRVPQLSPAELLWHRLTESRMRIPLPARWMQEVYKLDNIVTFYRVVFNQAELVTVIDRHVLLRSELLPVITIDGVVFEIAADQMVAARVTSLQNLQELIYSVDRYIKPHPAPLSVDAVLKSVQEKMVTPEQIYDLMEQFIQQQKTVETEDARRVVGVMEFLKEQVRVVPSSCSTWSMGMLHVGSKMLGLLGPMLYGEIRKLGLLVLPALQDIDRRLRELCQESENVAEEPESVASRVRSPRHSRKRVVAGSKWSPSASAKKIKQDNTD